MCLFGDSVGEDENLKKVKLFKERDTWQMLSINRKKGRETEVSVIGWMGYYPRTNFDLPTVWFLGRLNFVSRKRISKN